LQNEGSSGVFLSYFCEFLSKRCLGLVLPCLNTDQTIQYLGTTDPMCYFLVKMLCLVLNIHKY
jgi:hypothetical protein